MKRVDVVYSFIYDDNAEKVLVVHNADTDHWSLPGGAVEIGETLEQAVIRETFEETGLTVETNGIVDIREGFSIKNGHHVLFIVFQSHIVGGSISIQFPDEISKVTWVDLKVANELMPYFNGEIHTFFRSSINYYFEGTI